VTNTRKILIVDDDSELREALVEQLALHEEFESIAVDNGTKGVQNRQGRADRSRDHGCPSKRTDNSTSYGLSLATSHFSQVMASPIEIQSRRAH
jgi:CheY-like chemotaxis protein